jgi:hypothetical protein
MRDTSKGRFYTVITSDRVVNVSELDLLCGQGLDLVSESRIPGRESHGLACGSTWRYVFRNQRRPNTMGPL